MNEKDSVSSHSNNYDYYQLDYYDFEDTDSYYSGREEYLMKQQEDPDVINEKFISIQESSAILSNRLAAQ